MDIYIVDDKFQKVDVLDSFESLTWTDRYSGFSELEMVIAENNEKAKLLNVGWYIAREGSDRLIRIEKKLHNTNTALPGTLTVQGRSLEVDLFKRITQSAEGNTTLSGQAHVIIQMLVKHTFISNNNNVPLSDGWGTGDTNPLVIRTDITTSKVVNKSYPVDYAYTIIKAVADQVGIGFKWTMPGIESPIDEVKPTEVFTIYQGVDRSSKQTELPIVAFRPDLENLTDVSYVSDKSGYKTSAIVFGDQHRRVLFVNAPWHPGGVLRGPNSSVLLVDGNSIDVITPLSAFDSLLRTKALENLASHNHSKVIDGEVQNASDSYTYGMDYALGDIVEVSDNRDVIGRSRVTEYTYIFESGGLREFPSFTVVS